MKSQQTPPIMGAATGATPLMAPTIAKALAKSRPENLSAAIERAITIPPAPAIPCKKRIPRKNSILGAKIQAKVETTNTAIEMSKG